MNKKCNKCQQEKPLAEFRKDSSSKDGHHRTCTLCARKYHNSLYHTNYKESRRVTDGERRAEGRQMLNDARAGGCILCREDDLACLDFHHVNPADKDFTLGQASAYSVERIRAEIDKCVVLCANCHRKVHAEKLCLLYMGM